MCTRRVRTVRVRTAPIESDNLFFGVSMSFLATSPVSAAAGLLEACSDAFRLFDFVGVLTGVIVMFASTQRKKSQVAHAQNERRAFLVLLVTFSCSTSPHSHRGKPSSVQMQLSWIIAQDL